MRGLKGGRSGSLLGMQAEDLKGWLQEASSEKNPVMGQWRLLVSINHSTFKDVVVPEVVWEKMVFLPKGSRGYQGIGLVE